MKKLYELRDKLMEELDEVSRKQDMGMGDLELIHKLTDTIKNIDKICALSEGGGYSQHDGEWMANGRYSRDGDGGYSNRHWVRGHYSRDGRGGESYDDGEGGDYSGRRRDSRGRYSRDGGRTEMMEHLEMALDTANEQDRETIKRFMDKMNRM